MPGMPGMSGTTGLPALTWGRFVSTWQVHPGWLICCAAMLVLYLVGRRRAGAGSTVPTWRVASFCGGITLLWITTSSAIAGYAMSLFWMHMVLHLLLIIVVAAFVVLGHPLTVLIESFDALGQARVRAVLRSAPVAALTHYVAGVVIYSVVIIDTHLSGFMDQMAQHAWLMTGEQVLYVVAGFLFLLPLIGDEPINRRPPYLVRLVVLVAAMIPDTIVGIVLLQTSRAPYPIMMGMHPAWAPDPLTDAHLAGGLMWAVGDGLMMLVAVGLMISVITSPTRRENITGAWLESARRTSLLDHITASGGDEPPTTGGQILDADGVAAFEAYNQMLARLSGRPPDD